MRLVPFYFLYSGYIGSGSLNRTSSEGDYWSSTANSSSHAYNLDFDSSGVSPSNRSLRYSGFSIRCLAR